MKIASVLTTIQIPEAIKLYRACSSEVKLFVVGDLKTPEYETRALCEQVSAVYLSPTDQEKWKCSEAISWNCIQRRNAGFLEALKWGADIIHSYDDDNIPLERDYYDRFEMVMDQPFAGVEVVGKNGWVDPGAFLRPQAKHRGYPMQVPHSAEYRGVTGAKIGAVAGACLANPDIDATTRIVSAPDVQQVSLLLDAGCVVSNKSWTVFNSQNSAVLREFVPAWFMWPFAGRHDDIFASLLVQRVMRERTCQLHLGQPYVFQNRNEHDLVKDLRAEVDGYANVVKLAEILDHIFLPGKSVIDDCRRIWETLGHVDWVAGRTVEAAKLFLDDCEQLA